MSRPGTALHEEQKQGRAFEEGLTIAVVKKTPQSTRTIASLTGRVESYALRTLQRLRAQGSVRYDKRLQGWVRT